MKIRDFNGESKSYARPASLTVKAALLNSTIVGGRSCVAVLVSFAIGICPSNGAGAAEPYQTSAASRSACWSKSQQLRLPRVKLQPPAVASARTENSVTIDVGNLEVRDCSASGQPEETIVIGGADKRSPAEETVIKSGVDMALPVLRGDAKLAQLQRPALANQQAKDPVVIASDIADASNAKNANELPNPAGARTVEAESTQRQMPPVTLQGSEYLTTISVAKTPESTVSHGPLDRIVAAGLLEGILRFRSISSSEGTVPAISDGFEQELTRWEHKFGSGKYSAGGQAALFMKGDLEEGRRFTFMYDSLKDVRQRRFSDINPDKYYPVLGDSSERGYEVRTSGRAYLNVEGADGSLLYGEFATDDEIAYRRDGSASVDLGRYSRLISGTRIKRRFSRGYVDAFVMRDSLRQAVEEYRGNGTSGPFSIGNYNALENSEQVSIVVRDRNNPARVIQTRPLQRFSDYSFEPFSGRIVLNEALSSFDEGLNPISLRISYEVDTGGDKFWLYGGGAQVYLTDGIEIGATAVKNEDPGQPSGIGYFTFSGGAAADMRELVSANATISGSLGKLTVEGAQTKAATSADEILGSAARFDWTIGSRDLAEAKIAPLHWSLRVYGGQADESFANPASSLLAGRTEMGGNAKGPAGVLGDISISANYSADAFTDGSQTGGMVETDKAVTARLNVFTRSLVFSRRAGGVISSARQSNLSVIPNQGSVFGGAGLNPNGAGFWGIGVGVNPTTGLPQNMYNGSPLYGTTKLPDLDAMSFAAGSRYKLTNEWSVTGEVGQNYGFDGDPTWGAAGLSYSADKLETFARIEEPTGRGVAGAKYDISADIALYGRWENRSAINSIYSVDEASNDQAIVFGVTRSPDNENTAYSEFRALPGLNRRELQNVSGGRHTFPLSDALQAQLSAERLQLIGEGRSATALGGGLRLNDGNWRGGLRQEWRQIQRERISVSSAKADSFLTTLSLAYKIGPEWTGLFRDYFLATNDHGVRGAQLQNRFQIGGAYRPTGTTSFDALVRYENKLERNTELVAHEARGVNIVSANYNWHPVGALWLAGRVAAKEVAETLADRTDTYQAWLLAQRVTWDITESFDIGGMVAFTGSPSAGSLQRAYGLEAGYLLAQNTWISVGYNFEGFFERDLSGYEETMKGYYVRLRLKFDEKGLRGLLD